MLDGEVQEDAVVVSRAGNANRDSDAEDRLQSVFIDHSSANSGGEDRFEMALPFPLIVDLIFKFTYPFQQHMNVR
jgi:hypothetical protein